MIGRLQVAIALCALINADGVTYLMLMLRLYLL